MNTAMILADAKCFTSCCAGVRAVSFEAGEQRNALALDDGVRSADTAAHAAAPWTSAKLLGWLGCEIFPVAEGLSQ